MRENRSNETKKVDLARLLGEILALVQLGYNSTQIEQRVTERLNGASPSLLVKINGNKVITLLYNNVPVDEVLDEPAVKKCIKEYPQQEALDVVLQRNDPRLIARLPSGQYVGPADLSNRFHCALARALHHALNPPEKS